MSQTETEGTLLVAVANAETAERLLTTALDVAEDRSYGIVITYVVSVPPQIPLSHGDSVLEEEDREVLEYATEMVASADVPVEERIRYARDVGKGVVGAAAEYDADLVLMGWRGRPPRRDVILGSYLDAVLRNAPCDVLVKRIKTPQPEDVDRVLVPVADGPHNRLARELVVSIGRHNDASVTLLRVVDETSTDEEREHWSTFLEEASSEFEGVSVERELLEADHVAGAITDRTADHDVTILGSSERALLRRKLLGTVSKSVGRHAAGTVMIAQHNPAEASGLGRFVDRDRE